MSKIQDNIEDEIVNEVNEVYFNGVEYNPGKKDVEEIIFLGVKTNQVKLKENLTVFWNPLIWDWTKVTDKKAYETKYKRKTHPVYFKEKVFLVERSKMRKSVHEEEFVDTAELPIGIIVYWDKEIQEWQMMGYKESMLH